MPSDFYTNPFTLTGTKIDTMVNSAQKLSARTHRQANETENPIELWYLRDSTWRLFPVQPLTGPKTGLELTQVYQQPASLHFTLPDPDGLYAAENLESDYNYNSIGAYDPLLDEARKIVLRVGTRCYTNLASGITPTSTLATAGGSSAALSALTDGVTGTASTQPSLFCQFATPSAAPFTFTVDLGASKAIRHSVIRFGTYTGTCTLPSSVQISVSADNLTYVPWPARPVGGAGSTSIVPGDWHDSTVGQEIECAFCDMLTTGRYVKFTVTPTAAQAIWIDEIAVYGGNATTTLGCNLFTGYMGDAIDFTNAGMIECVAIDVLKKLQDNSDAWLTAAYRMTTTAVELGDIVYSLLTSTAYWNQSNAYNSPLSPSEIGWSSGSGLTGLQYPLWQGQTNTILGYCRELFAVIGWHMYADGNGTIQAVDPPYTQRLPDRVCIAANDGNYDVRRCVRHRTGKEMRNRVVVGTGKSKESGSGQVVLFEPNSITRYGQRTTRITDPLASTIDLREKVAQFFIRDWAWRLQAIENNVKPQFETRLKQIFAFRAPARPNLFARTATTTPYRRKRELWSLESLRHTITYGEWSADASYVPYVAQTTAPLNFTALNTVGGHTDQMTAVFDAVTDPDAVAIKAYVSTTSQYSGFAIYAATIPAATSLLLTGLTPAVPIWVYLTSVDDEGNDSVPSQVLTGIPGSQSQSITCYTVTDFTCESFLTSGPDSQGFFTYQFLALWTAPACGMTTMYIRLSPGSLPIDDHHWPLGSDKWHWWGPDRILSGRQWNNVDLGQLDFVITMRTTQDYRGTTMYARIWNSQRTRREILVTGNYDTTVVLS